MTDVALLAMTAARTTQRAHGRREPSETANWRLGDYILAEMQARGIEDQTEVAALLGVNQSSVSRWITGESRGPSGDNMKRLAEFLHLPVQEVYGIKHRVPGPISATALEREVRSLQQGLDHANRKLEKLEALVDVLIRATGATAPEGRKARS